MAIDSMLDFLSTTYTIVLPILMTYFISVLHTNTRNRDATTESSKLMLRVYIMDMHEKFMIKNYVTEEEYKTYMEIWKLYHDGFNGNLLTDRYKDDVEALEIKCD